MSIDLSLVNINFIIQNLYSINIRQFESVGIKILLRKRLKTAINNQTKAK